MVFDDESNSFITFNTEQSIFNIDTFETEPGNYSVSLYLNEFGFDGTLLSSNKYIFYMEVLKRLEADNNPPIFYI